MSASTRSDNLAPDVTASRTRPVSLDFARSAPYFASLLGLALIAFWPTYLSLGPAGSSMYVHLHAITATVWMVFLITQPIAIRTRQLTRHRAVGRMSYVLAPLVIVSVVLLAHTGIRNAGADDFAIRSYVLYLQTSLVTMFTLSYALAMLTRRVAPLHARYMICTSLTLIDPIVIRVMFWIDPTPTWNYQWLTFGLTDAVLVALIWLDRDRRSTRWVFPVMLGAFALSQAPALLGLTDGSSWQAFARWFAALPLT